MKTSADAAVKRKYSRIRVSSMPRERCVNVGCKAMFSRSIFSEKGGLNQLCPTCKKIAGGSQKRCDLCHKYFTRPDFARPSFYAINHTSHDEVSRFCVKWQICQSCQPIVDQLPNGWVVDTAPIHTKHVAFKHPNGEQDYTFVYDGTTIVHEHPNYYTCKLLMIKHKNGSSMSSLFGGDFYKKHGKKLCSCTHGNPYDDVDGGHYIVDDL